jgi:hypothetical protein
MDLYWNFYPHPVRLLMKLSLTGLVCPFLDNLMNFTADKPFFLNQILEEDCLYAVFFLCRKMLPAKSEMRGSGKYDMYNTRS